MSVEGENAEKKAKALLDKLHKYNNSILGSDNLEESIIDRVNAAKDLKDILDKAREQQLKAKEDYLNNET
jgi:hypothetical protein|tara:strand:- start:1446 stop:1655 length:210 start_codon:yes stop_codon:yes gene_type:complete